jgi:hypothetical protein
VKSVVAVGLEVRLRVAIAGSDGALGRAARCGWLKRTVGALFRAELCAPALAGAVGRGPDDSAAGAAVERICALAARRFGLGYHAETDARFP